jgi:serine/threonine protein kinase
VFDRITILVIESGRAFASLWFEWTFGMDEPADFTHRSAESSVDDHAATAVKRLAEARAGSHTAVDELFENCRNYLLLIANAGIGDGLQSKVAASDLVRQTLLAGERDFEEFAGQSEEELQRWLTRILEKKLGEFHHCLRVVDVPQDADTGADEGSRQNASAETVTLAVNGQPVNFEQISGGTNRAAGGTGSDALFGRFEIVREIGRGGHGVVFLARDPVLNRQVALKVPQPEILLSPSMRRRFLAEGRAAAVLAHPNLVTVFEAGELGPVCYIAQAYIAGTSLQEWLKRRTAHVPPEVAATIVARLADGVSHAHSRGILHRDLKPGNVLLDMECEHESESAVVCPDQQTAFVPKITDFGIAKSLESDGNETATGTILGTAAYMSPEQAAGDNRRVGPATDVYSLGAILYELLTRQAAFRGDTYVDTLRLVATVEATAPHKMRQGLPRDLEAICLKCLEKDPARRYATAFELAADLRNFLAGEPTSARPVRRRERVVRWCRRNPAWSALVGVSVVAVLSLLAILFWSNVRLGRQLEETVKEQSRAEANEKRANERERDAKNRAYAADMRLVGESWSTASAPTVENILQTYVPGTVEADLRGFELWTTTRRQKNWASTGVVLSQSPSMAGTISLPAAGATETSDCGRFRWDSRPASWWGTKRRLSIRWHSVPTVSNWRRPATINA